MPGTATAQLPAALLPDDVLTAILVLAKRFSKQDRMAFRGHDSALQKVFQTLSEEFPNDLKPFVFSDSGPEPYSPVLSESISRLQLSGLVGRENPDYEVIFLRSSAERYFDEDLKRRFSPEDLDHLESLAERFWGLVQK
jgi:hypothetical protein